MIVYCNALYELCQRWCGLRGLKKDKKQYKKMIYWLIVINSLMDKDDKSIAIVAGNRQIIKNKINLK